MTKLAMVALVVGGCLALTLPGASACGPLNKGKPADGIIRTVNVELKGQLIWHKPVRCQRSQFTLVVDGTHYDLSFGNKTLSERARTLAGQTVVVTATLSEDSGRKEVCVTGLKADGSAKKTVQIEVKGRLVRGKRLRTAYIGNAWGKYPFPVYEWSVRAGKETYHLDMGFSEQFTAEGLNGQLVVVTGTLSGDRIRVTGLKGETAVRTTTTIEVRGKLVRLRPERWHYIGLPGELVSMVLIKREAWCIEVDGTLYELDFSRGMPLSLGRMEGTTVAVRGTLLKDRLIQVAELKPDTTGAVTQTVQVEVTGKLCRDGAGNTWKVEVNGTLYTLDLGAAKVWYRQAQQWQGLRVVVKGTLENGVVKVKSFERALELCGTTPRPAVNFGPAAS
jgi:hypothetical protein